MNGGMNAETYAAYNPLFPVYVDAWISNPSTPGLHRENILHIDLGLHLPYITQIISAKNIILIFNLSY